jgi:two-component system sensor histidine kinase and response regulator WspE
VNPSNPEDYSNLSMFELFRVETENQAGVLTSGLLELERGSKSPEQLEALMRAAHSLKGASRIVNFVIAVQVAHAMEDCFVAAQRGKLTLERAHIDVLLRGVDLLLNISKCDEKSMSQWESDHAAEIESFLRTLAGFEVGL